MITLEQFKACLLLCKNAGAWHVELVKALPSSPIATPKQLAAFIAQTGHESADWNIVSENLNYSAESLRRVFKKYFPDDETAKAYERQPAKIADRVYANRMGNGDEKSGDGYRYRGRGLIQLTGKTNYRDFSMAHYKTQQAVVDPSIVAMPAGALASAFWFWRKNELNKYIDDIVMLTKKINGGTHGIEDRFSRFERACKVLNLPAPKPLAVAA